MDKYHSNNQTSQYFFLYSWHVRGVVTYLKRSSFLGICEITFLGVFWEDSHSHGVNSKIHLLAFPDHSTTSHSLYREMELSQLSPCEESVEHYKQVWFCQPPQKQWFGLGNLKYLIGDRENSLSRFKETNVECFSERGCRLKYFVHILPQKSFCGDITMFVCFSIINLTKRGGLSKRPMLLLLCWGQPLWSSWLCSCSLHREINGQGQVHNSCPEAGSFQCLPHPRQQAECLSTTAWAQPVWLKDMSPFIQWTNQVLN